MKKLLILWMTLLPSFVFCQWSNDTTSNLIIYNGSDLDSYYRSGHTLQGCRDGSVFISWYDLDTVLHVQRLDQDGFPIWDKTTTFKRPYFQGVGSIMDNEENIILTITWYNPSIAGYEYHLYKVSKNGLKLWGDSGIVFKDENRQDNIYNTRYATNEFGDVFFGRYKYVDESRIRIIHRITPNGTLPWGEDGLVIPDQQQSFKVFPDIITTRKNGFFILHGNYIGVHHDDFSYEMFLRKYDLNGETVWKKDPMIYRGYLRYWTLDILKGNNDDFYIGWSPNWMQHIYSDGSLDWSGGGINITQDTTSFDYFGAELIGFTRDDNLLVYFTRHDRSYNNPTLHGQLIGKEGERLWGDAGRPIEIEDFNGRFAYKGKQYQAKLYNDTVFLFYRYPLHSFPSHPFSMKVMAMNLDANPAWKESKTVSAESESKNLPMVTNFIKGQCVMLWSEYSTDRKAIVKAQNIYSDGTLGAKTVSNAVTHIEKDLFVGCDPINKTLIFDMSVGRGFYNLYNSSGTKICNGKIESQISLPYLPSGIYILNIQTQDSIESYKLFLW